MEHKSSASIRREEITVKFGKGLVGKPFTSKKGRECVSIRIPNADASDSRPWETIVVAANHVHENQFGKGVWMKIPADGEMRVNRSEITGKTEDGKNLYSTTTRMVPNRDIKAMLERYKQQSKGNERTSVANALKKPGISEHTKRTHTAGMER